MSEQQSPKILNPKDSSYWRDAYLNAFVDVSSAYYQNNIAKLQQYSDGRHYFGYVWDCFREPQAITYERLRNEVMQFTEIFVMADDHSRQKVMGAPLWPYPPYSVVNFKPQIFLNALVALPEDLYIFDSSVSWTLVLTHEYNDEKRICLTVGIESQAA